MRRSLAVSCVTGAIALSSVVLAQPAMAASQALNLSCASPYASPYPIGLAPSETFTVTIVSGADCARAWHSASDAGTWTRAAGGLSDPWTDREGAFGEIPAYPGTSYTFTASSTGTGIMQFTNLGGAFVQTFNITVSSTDAAPPPVLQQFARPATGTCDAAAPASLNWAGVPSGGWGESWAQWANGGAGGAVCTRTLMYSQSAGAWTVS